MKKTRETKTTVTEIWCDECGREIRSHCARPCAYCGCDLCSAPDCSELDPFECDWDGRGWACRACVAEIKKSGLDEAIRGIRSAASAEADRFQALEDDELRHFREVRKATRTTS